MIAVLIDVVAVVVILTASAALTAASGWHLWPQSVDDALGGFSVACLFVLWAYVRAWNNRRTP